MMIFSFACLYDCIECVKDFKLSVQQNGVVSNTVVKPVSLFTTDQMIQHTRRYIDKTEF